ncbi:MAG: hypothetical protein KatS3mg050_4069 [Litorilinea sp.]|nr:MAG: hypothetical protein KatS3mg050_4069 [Litorilinea sp.]
MLVFIHINKTAGRTVRYILRSSFGGRHCEVEPWHAPWTGPPFSSADLARLRRYYPRLESIGGHRLRGYVDLEEAGTTFRYFTFMRDPLRTCASRFQYNVQYRGKKDLVFEDWIQQKWVRNHQTKMIAGSADVDKAIRILRRKNIFVGLTEHFDESLFLLKALVAPGLDISYRRVNVAGDKTIAKQLLTDKASRQLLVEANQADLALYQYVCHELFPQYRADYGPHLDSHLRQYQQQRQNRFNYWNLTVSRLKQYLLYKPVLYLYRKGVPVA